MFPIEHWLNRAARWPVLLALALASLVLMGLMSRVGAHAGQPEATALDLRWGYTPAEVQQAIAPLTPAQREQAARLHLTLDVLYPLVYGSLFALLLFALWPGRRWWLLAGAVVLVDWTENAFLATIYRAYPQRQSLVPWASTVTQVKWALVGLVTLLILVGLGRRLWSRLSA